MVALVLVLWSLAGCSSSPPPPVPGQAFPKPAAETPAEEDAGDEADATAPARPGAPPAILAMRFVPEHPKEGENIEVQLRVKNPSKAQLKTTYLWSINGTPSYDLTENVFPGNQQTRGDKLSVTVTISDGTREVSRDSSIVEIGNSPPTLVTTTAEFANLDGLEVRATDPDDDRLTYRFEGAPDGLTISESGRVSYQGSETAKAGTYAVTLVVDDGHTGYARLPFKITVAGGQSQQRVKKGATPDATAEATSP